MAVEGAHTTILRNPSHPVRNLTTWFQLGIHGDAGPRDQEWSRGFSIRGVRLLRGKLSEHTAAGL